MPLGDSFSGDASAPPAPARATPAAVDSPSGQTGGDGQAWIPIRSLGPRHRRRILEHLQALDLRSRYLRFGYAATDAHIARYVDALDFERDQVFGIFNRRLELIALAHLAHRPSEPPEAGARAGSEFGVSVLPKARRRGFGSYLFRHAMLHARNRGVQTMFIHALSENVPMLTIARRAGATVERDGSESEAWLRLPRGSLASHIDELLGDGAAEVDYQLKRRTHRAGLLHRPPAGDK